MQRTFITLGFGAVLLLSGCFQAVAIPETTARSLTPVHTEKLPYHTRYLEFSSNGDKLIAGGNYKFVTLYDIQAQHNAIALNNEHTELSSGQIYGAGFIDANTWYYAYTTDKGDVEAIIRQINPPQMVFKHNFGSDTDRPVQANKTHLAQSKVMLDWRNTEHSYRVVTAHPVDGGYTLTESSRVLTYNGFNGFVGIHDPVKQEVIGWKADSGIAYVLLSADERYALEFSSKGKCVLRQLPEAKKVGSCGRNTLLKHSVGGHITFQSDSRMFAVSRNNEIRVYTVEPFKQVLSVTTPEQVTGLALNEGRLAAEDDADNIHIWDVASGNSLGKYVSNTSGLLGTGKLVFQPNTNRLFVNQNDTLLVFDFSPETASQEEAAP